MAHDLIKTKLQCYDTKTRMTRHSVAHMIRIRHAILVEPGHHTYPKQKNPVYLKSTTWPCNLNINLNPWLSRTHTTVTQARNLGLKKCSYGIINSVENLIARRVVLSSLILEDNVSGVMLALISNISTAHESQIECRALATYKAWMMPGI